MATVRLDAADAEIRSAWHHVFDLVEAMPDDGWALIGGMMVQVHISRFGAPTLARATKDVDLLGDARKRPSVTEKIGGILASLGYRPMVTSASASQSMMYRFVDDDGRVVDILGPDGLKHPPQTLPGGETIQVKGGTQALLRAERVEVVAGDRSAIVPVPSLPAAIVLKSLTTGKAGRELDREDLVALLSVVDDPQSVRDALTPKELRALRAREDRLHLDAAELYALIPPDRVSLARAAFKAIVS